MSFSFPESMTTFPAYRGGVYPWVVEAIKPGGSGRRVLARTLIVAPTKERAAAAGRILLRVRGHGRRPVQARRASAYDLGMQPIS